MVVRKIGKYEVGRTIGEGTFAKVKYAQNTETGESVAMKVLDKATILKHKMVDQIKREICVMKLVRHPNVVRLHEVLASRGKIYIVLEFITGGELFDKIVHQGRLSEEHSRRYFQQLIDAVDYCHSKGVYHRDLKPENLLLDAQQCLKISDFGLSALPQQERDDGLLHTTCGTPNYVAPEVLNDKGYDGAVADVWSCGVILFVLIAGFLPFDEADLATLYRKIRFADFQCPQWFSPGVKSLITCILEPNPQKRITIAGIRRDEWFMKNYIPVRQDDEEEIDLDDVQAVFSDVEERFVDVQKAYKDVDLGPSMMNAFELITLSQGLNLSVLFDRRLDHVRRQTCFISKQPAKRILSRLTEAATELGFRVESRNYKGAAKKKQAQIFYVGFDVYQKRAFRLVALRDAALTVTFHMGNPSLYVDNLGVQKMRLEGTSSGKGGQMGQMAVAVEVFEVAPSLYMVEVRKAVGDTLDYHKFYKSFCAQLRDIIWKSAAAKTDKKDMVSPVSSSDNLVVPSKYPHGKSRKD